MKRLVISLLTASLMIPSFAYPALADTSFDSSPQILFAASQSDGVTDFVTRLYSICLDRQPDSQGLNDWASKLRSKQITGIEAAYGFIFSSEFQNRNLSNGDYVEKMYQAFLGRNSDETGRSQWVSAMDNGMSRTELFSGFANSQEFTAICQSYGIERGDYSPENGFVNTAQIRAFVTRLYSICLGRNPDENGLNEWASMLASRRITGTEAAAGFFFSPEYKNKNRSNEEFVTDLYNCFLGRTPDAQGLSAWVAQLDNGTSDIEIFNGFSQSSEYSGICESYGIERGGAYNTTESCRNVVPTNEPDYSGYAEVLRANKSKIQTYENTYTDGITSVLYDINHDGIKELLFFGGERRRIEYTYRNETNYFTDTVYGLYIYSMDRSGSAYMACDPILLTTSPTQGGWTYYICCSPDSRLYIDDEYGDEYWETDTYVINVSDLHNISFEQGYECHLYMPGSIMEEVNYRSITTDSIFRGDRHASDISESSYNQAVSSIDSNIEGYLLYTWNTGVVNPDSRGMSRINDMGALGMSYSDMLAFLTR